MNETETDRLIRHPVGRHGRVVFRGVDAEVRVRGTDREEAVISLQLSGGPDDPDEDELPLRIRRGQGSLELEAASVPGVAQGLFGLMRRGRLPHVDEVIMEVPRGAHLRIETVSGDLDVHGTEGDQHFRTVSGDVALHDTGGAVRATTVSGDLSLRGDRSAAVALSSTSGDVSLRLPWLRGSTITSFSGDVDVDAGIVPGSEHRIETISGEVALALDGGFTAEVATPAGQIDVGLPHERRRESGRRWIRVGDGAARVSVRTMSGDVSFRPSRHHRSEPAPPAVALDALDEAPDGITHADRGTHPAPVMPPFPPPPPSPTAPAAPAEPDPDRQLRILRAVAAGELDPDEAARMLEEDIRA